MAFMGKSKRKASRASEIAKIARRERRMAAIVDGCYGRPSVRFEDRRKQESKRAAKGRSYKGEW
jgi:hypothetical protein